MKGLLFVGCSFTYGHGLWHYCDHIENSHDDEVGKLRRPHFEFRDVHRFPTLVSNHFNTYKITKPEWIISGDDETSLDFTKNFFDEGKVYYSDIDYIIFQTSFPDRNHFILATLEQLESDPFGLYKKTRHHNDIFEFFKKIKQDINNYHDYKILQYSILIRKSLEFYESKGIKTKIISITNDYRHHIENDWLNERMIKINYLNGEYFSFNDLFASNENLQIHKDFDSFTDPPKDFHPSLLCHRIVADSIINNLI